MADLLAEAGLSSGADRGSITTSPPGYATEIAK
jgi:hypothetical protein